MNLARFAAVLSLLALSACQATAQPVTEAQACPATLTQTERVAIAANSAGWLKAVRAADWSAVASTYTSDAILLPPNQPAVSGRDAIQRWFAAFPPIVSIDLIDAEVEGCCGLAFVRGSYRLAISPPGMGTLTESGKYIEIRRKQPDGTWLKLRDMFSSDDPAHP